MALNMGFSICFRQVSLDLYNKIQETSEKSDKKRYI